VVFSCTSTSTFLSFLPPNLTPPVSHHQSISPDPSQIRYEVVVTVGLGVVVCGVTMERAGSAVPKEWGGAD